MNDVSSNWYKLSSVNNLSKVVSTKKGYFWKSGTKTKFDERIKKSKKIDKLKSKNFLSIEDVFFFFIN